MMKDLVVKNRSYRRFHENEMVSADTLRSLVNLGRLSASGANLQPLKYILSNTPEQNHLIFSCLAWAGYLKDWHGPEEGERPSAYIVMLGDTRIATTFGCDHGIAAQSIMLGAVEAGLGGCMIGSIRRENLRNTLEIPEYLDILLVLALGRPLEEVMLEAGVGEGAVKYWRDAAGVHHVPKRSLEEVIL
ncbi:TPA: nitroreductase [Candidatus Sumerlaeota bacterium]|nr:nitroreductase [Candidatus Sumerlaeota bacterium]